MATTTIRVSVETRDTINALAHEEGIAVQELVNCAIESYRRQRLLEATNAAYAALRADRSAWDDLQQEQMEWDATIADGLEDE